MSSLITLKTKSEFNKIYRKGKRVNCNSFTIIFLPSNELKFAFVVSKKVGNAVIRNKIKRRLRAISRELIKNSKLKKGSFLYLTKPTIKAVKFDILKSDIEKCLLQLKQ